jgi:hypothetical protein
MAREPSARLRDTLNDATLMTRIDAQQPQANVTQLRGWVIAAMTPAGETLLDAIEVRLVSSPGAKAPAPNTPSGAWRATASAPKAASATSNAATGCAGPDSEESMEPEQRSDGRS